MKIPFWKVEAIGNDFVLVHLDGLDPNSLPDLARRVSPRRFGVGSDGLLAVGTLDGRLVLRMFNPDGSEDFCGNGLRCAAWHAVLEAEHGRPMVAGSAFEIMHGGLVMPAKRRIAAGGNQDRDPRRD